MTTRLQEELCRSVARLAANLDDDLVRRDREAVFDRDGWRACAGAGLLGLPLPERLGGSERDLLTCIVVMEAFGRACRDNGLVFSLNAQLWAVARPLLAFGSDAQQRRYLPGLADGTLIGAHAITEPEAGSDALALATRAVADGETYVLNGRKTFVTNAPVADVVLVFATVRPDVKAAGITAFVVERDAPGVIVGPALDKMGLRTSPMSDVALDDCRVPAAARLGREGQGMAIFHAAMRWERACIFAANLGAMTRVMERCVAHARDRRQFGRPIGSFAPIADRIATMRVNVELGRLLLREIGRLDADGAPADLQATMAKLFISEAHVQATLDAIQIFGGYGYATESGIEREHRDAVAGRLYSGTSEMQRKLIAAHLGL